jgi:hypothetical protein
MVTRRCATEPASITSTELFFQKEALDTSTQ